VALLGLAGKGHGTVHARVTAQPPAPVHARALQFPTASSPIGAKGIACCSCLLLLHSGAARNHLCGALHAAFNKVVLEQAVAVVVAAPSQKPAPLDAPILTLQSCMSCKPSNPLLYAYGMAAKAEEVSAFAVPLLCGPACDAFRPLFAPCSACAAGAGQRRSLTTCACASSGE
jgi:hypothetical protein